MKNLLEIYLNFDVNYRTLIFYKPTKHQLPLPFKVVFLLQFVQRFNFKNCKVTPICTSSLTISLPNFMFSSFIPELNKRFDSYSEAVNIKRRWPRIPRQQQHVQSLHNKICRSAFMFVRSPSAH